MDRQSFYIGALLHDIGKFIERAKSKERERFMNMVLRFLFLVGVYEGF